MKRWIVGTLVLALLGFFAVVGFVAVNWSEETTVPDPSATEALAATPVAEREAAVARRAAHHGVPSYAVTVSDPGQPDRSYFGGAASDGSLFQSASLSKTVAAAGILALARREGIGLDADIRDHVTSVDLRALPGGDRPVTLRELLSHTRKNTHRK